MKTATGTVVRGEYRFTITVTNAVASHGADGNALPELDATSVEPYDVQVTVWHQGERIDAGRLEHFAPGYLASLRYRLEFRRTRAKPVGRIGGVLIGPDAWEALRKAITAAEHQVASSQESVSAQ